MNPETITIVATRVVLSHLTDDELAEFRIAYEWNDITVLKETKGYPKIKHLLTEQGKTRMHSLVFMAFDQYVAERLNKPMGTMP